MYNVHRLEINCSTNRKAIFSANLLSLFSLCLVCQFYDVLFSSFLLLKASFAKHETRFALNFLRKKLKCQPLEYSKISLQVQRFTEDLETALNLLPICSFIILILCGTIQTSQHFSISGINLPDTIQDAEDFGRYSYENIRG